MTTWKRISRAFKGVRLTAIDMDGTLMDSSDHVAETAIALIRELNEKGSLVVPCSGRYLRSIPRELLLLGKVRYAITANGAQIWDLRSLSSLYRVKLPKGTVKSVLEFMNGREGYIEIFSQGKSYINEGDAIRAGRIERDYNFIQYFRQNHVLVPGLSRAVDIWDEAEKMNIFFMEEDDRRELESILQRRGDLKLTSSVSGNMEINALSVNKGIALEWLCRHLDIPRENVLAIGDGDNDVEMLQYAGYGVAMGNSWEALKNYAGYVTGDNDHGGAEDVLKSVLQGLSV